jgi:hypothetical protein
LDYLRRLRGRTYSRRVSPDHCQYDEVETSKVTGQFWLGAMFGVTVVMFIVVLFTPLSKFGKR